MYRILFMLSLVLVSISYAQESDSKPEFYLDFSHSRPVYLMNKGEMHFGHYVGGEYFQKNSGSDIGTTILFNHRFGLRASLGASRDVITHGWFNDLANIGGLQVGDLMYSNGSANNWSISLQVFGQITYLRKNKLALYATLGGDIRKGVFMTGKTTNEYVTEEWMGHLVSADDYRTSRYNGFVNGSWNYGCMLGPGIRYLPGRFLISFEALASYKRYTVVRFSYYNQKNVWSLGVEPRLTVGYKL